MKTTLIVSLITALSIATNFSSAQKLTFCEKADASGNAINANTTFAVAKNGGPVTLLFNLAAGSKLSAVNFDLYKVVDGKEIYQSTIKQPISGSWVAKQVTLYDAGKYSVYVFDDADNQLAKGELMIKK